MTHWLIAHEYVEPINVGGECEYVAWVTSDGLGTAFCGKRREEHTIKEDWATRANKESLRIITEKMRAAVQHCEHGYLLTDCVACHAKRLRGELK